MKQNTHGRGELLNFLKGETHQHIDWTKEVELTKSTQSNQLKGRNLAVQQVFYKLSDLNGYITDPMVVERPQAGRKFIFRNVTAISQDEAIAETLETEQL